MTTEHGHVVAVTSDPVGDTLAVAADAGDEVLTLEDVSPFSEHGGVASIDDGSSAEDITYTTVDPELETMTLDAPLADSYAIEATVTTGKRVRMARVRLDDDDDAPVNARVPYSMMALLPIGIRESEGESVIVELLRGQWVIRDVLGEEPDLPEGPGTEDAVDPPTPLAVRAIADIDAVICDWNDPLDAADADLADSDIKGYQVEVVSGPTPDFTTPLKAWKLRPASRARFETSHYRRRYWFRVRTIDHADNASDWIVVGPIRPAKTAAGRTVVSATGAPQTGAGSGLGIDIVNSAGYALMTGESASARLASVTDRGVVSVDGDDSDGTLTGKVHTGSVETRVYAGFAVRVVDASNFLGVALVHDGTSARIEATRWVAGAATVIGTSTAQEVEPETSYDLEVILEGTSIRAYVNDVLRLTLTESSHLTATGYGPFSRRTTSGRDNGQSRVGEWRFVPATVEVPSAVEDATWSDPNFTWSDARVSWDGTTEGTGTVEGPTDVPTIDDDWLRSSGAALGEAASGQVYAGENGTWQIERSAVPNTFLGAAMIMPVYSMEVVEATDFNAPATGARLIGKDGIDSGARTFYVDRPTRLMMDAVATLGNRGTAKFNVRFWIIVVVDGVLTYGRGVSQIMTPDGEPVTEWRNVKVMREKFVDASLDSPTKIEIWWGFRNDTGQGRQMRFRDLQLRVWATYAPDYSPVFDPRRRAAWTPYGANRVAYRYETGEDTDADVIDIP